MDRKQLIENQLKYLAEEKASELSKHKDLIAAFIDFCKEYNIDLHTTDFDYHQGLGILCFSKNIALKINPAIKLDKEGLVNFGRLTNAFEKKPFYEGSLFGENHILYASPYF